jgi:hypothetical protein
MSQVKFVLIHSNPKIFHQYEAEMHMQIVNNTEFYSGFEGPIAD